MLFPIFVEVVLIFLEGMGETRPAFFLFLFVSVHDGGKDSRDMRGGGGNRKGGRKKETLRERSEGVSHVCVSVFLRQPVILNHSTGHQVHYPRG